MTKILPLISNHKIIVRAFGSVVAGGGVITIFAGAIILTGALLPHSFAGVMGNMYAGPTGIGMGIAISTTASIVILLSFRPRQKSKILEVDESLGVEVNPSEVEGISLPHTEIRKVEIQILGHIISHVEVPIYKGDRYKDVYKRVFTTLNLNSNDWIADWYVAGKNSKDSTLEIKGDKAVHKSVFAFRKKIYGGKIPIKLAQQERKLGILEKIFTNQNFPPFVLMELDTSKTKVSQITCWHGTKASNEELKKLIKMGFSSESTSQTTAGNGVYLAFSKEHATKYSYTTMMLSSRQTGSLVRVQTPILKKTANINDYLSWQSYCEFIANQILTFCTENLEDDDFFNENGEVDIGGVSLYNLMLQKLLVENGYDSVYLHGKEAEKITGGPTLVIIDPLQIQNLELSEWTEKVELPNRVCTPSSF